MTGYCIGFNEIPVTDCCVVVCGLAAIAIVSSFEWGDNEFESYLDCLLWKVSTRQTNITLAQPNLDTAPPPPPPPNPPKESPKSKISVLKEKNERAWIRIFFRAQRHFSLWWKRCVSGIRIFFLNIYVHFTFLSNEGKQKSFSWRSLQKTNTRKVWYLVSSILPCLHFPPQFLHGSKLFFHRRALLTQASATASHSPSLTTPGASSWSNNHDFTNTRR